ncbi:Uncharacterized protein HSRCO_0006 [Halanaeroarchaeum sp. HSR-CO]|uniref:hypothetical protein n=1 Tax=Halanaeroarchaeum sp. HSR-CO TaxID=2866382 RepID=UPI00217CDFA3|nr:hypothetical protein [Halanaeroarchaeum sp. HSR-CO]UWG46309.1 Uncharacterized protein HSRCO_0006 [Halanaeroarchaeum sp. HSR-CO]
MNIREATDDDVDALAALVDADLDAERLVHERTVLVAVAETDEGVEADGTGDVTDSEEDTENLLGFVSYDTWSETIHLSTLVGEPPVVDALLDEPRRLADAADMPVEIVVPEHDEQLESVVTEAGFERVGKGPLFDGRPSHRYRYNDE